MPEILLKRDSGHNATSVPNTFIDEYMIHANGEFVKIYLRLGRYVDFIPAIIIGCISFILTTVLYLTIVFPLLFFLLK